MNGLGTGRSSHGSGQLWGRPWWSPQCPCAGEILSGRGQAPPYVPAPFPGFLTYRPVRRGRYSVSPRRRESASRTARGSSKKGESQFPLLGRFKGWIVKAGEIGIPRLNRLFRPFLAAQKGARRRHDKKADTKMVSMEGAPARHKAGRCGQKVNCPEGQERPPWASAPTLGDKAALGLLK